jgi:hypothetical protein
VNEKGWDGRGCVTVLYCDLFGWTGEIEVGFRKTAFYAAVLCVRACMHACSFICVSVYVMYVCVCVICLWFNGAVSNSDYIKASNDRMMNE